MKRINISNNVIRRMPRYLRKLEDLSYHGIDRISSSELGRQLGLTPSQIRQDFSCFGEFGQQGYGYNVEKLRDEISSILGMKNDFSVILVGVGNLGHALVNNFGFENHGFNLKAAFDVDPAIVGGEVGSVHVYHSSELMEYLSRNHVDIAVLSVPRRLADDMANTLVDYGIRAIWNFTNIELDIKNEDVLVENIHFSDSLLYLSYHLAEQAAEENED
ncbi:MAG: redox-sensing transcriptional repressor Rex [Candidatus Heteroscillospira sp.]|jgi:redox-sensing transcriptional repressor